MVPFVSQDSDLGACGDGEVQLNEAMARYTTPNRPAVAGTAYATAYVRCALQGPGSLDGEQVDPEAVDPREAVSLWALLASGMVGRQEVERALRTGASTGFLLPSPATAEAALAMAALPPAQVRAGLAPVWERLRAGTLPAAELPGQRP
jgi:hypothetical protein